MGSCCSSPADAEKESTTATKGEVVEVPAISLEVTPESAPEPALPKVLLSPRQFDKREDPTMRMMTRQRTNSAMSSSLRKSSSERMSMPDEPPAAAEEPAAAESPKVETPAAAAPAVAPAEAPAPAAVPEPPPAVEAPPLVPAGSSGMWMGTVGVEDVASSVPALVAGVMSISVRSFPLPVELVGKPLLLLTTPDPPEGHSTALPDWMGDDSGLFEVAGVITFSSGSSLYDSRAAFDADASRHGIKPKSRLHAKYAGEGKGWKGSLPAYKWQVQSARKLPSVPESAPALRRRNQTLFDVEGAGWEAIMAQDAGGGVAL